VALLEYVKAVRQSKSFNSISQKRNVNFLPEKTRFWLVSASMSRWLWLGQACVIILGLGTSLGFGLIDQILFHSAI